MFSRSIAWIENDPIDPKFLSITVIWLYIDEEGANGSFRRTVLSWFANFVRALQSDNVGRNLCDWASLICRCRGVRFLFHAFPFKSPRVSRDIWLSSNATMASLWVFIQAFPIPKAHATVTDLAYLT